MGASEGLALSAGVAKLAQTLISGTTPMQAMLTVKGWLEFEEQRLLLYAHLARENPELRGLLGMDGNLILPEPNPDAFEAERPPPSVAQVVANREAGLMSEHAGSHDPLWLQFVRREERKQENVSRVMAAAREETERLEEEGQTPDAEPVNATWASRFFQQAELIQDADLQAAWGKLLAGEVMTPGSYSPRALQILEVMRPQDAALWNRVVSMCLRFIWLRDDGWEYVPGSLPMEWVYPQEDEQRVVGHEDLQALVSLGLFSSAQNSSLDLEAAQGRVIGLPPHLLLAVVRPGGLRITLRGQMMSPAGTELANLVTEPTPLVHAEKAAELLYEKGADVYLYPNGLELMKVENGQAKLPEGAVVKGRMHARP